MVRGVYIQRSASERMTLEAALKRYLADVTPTKKPSTQKSERHKANTLSEQLGKYSLAALTPELIANYRDTRINSLGRRGQPIRANTVRAVACDLRPTLVATMLETPGTAGFNGRKLGSLGTENAILARR